MAHWTDELDHVKVHSSIPTELADRMDKVRGKFNRSRFIRNLIEAEVDQLERASEMLNDFEREPAPAA